MKKKPVYGVLFILSMFLFIGCTNENSKESTQLVKETSVTQEQAYANIRKIAFNWVNETEKTTIINMDSAEIEELNYKEDYFVSGKSDSININGKTVYKVTFENTSNDLLGPIVIFIEKSSLEVLGTIIRK